MKDLHDLGITTLKLDVSDQESVDATLKRITEESGRLDILFNNAGTSCTFPAIDLKIEDAKQCYDVNFFGVIRVTNAAISLLKASKGTIVNTGSVAGFVYFPYSSIYASSKAALHHYSHVLRVELAPFEVKVVTLVVGGVDTDIADSRPLPKESSYYIVEEAIAARRTMAKDNSPMSAADFAKSIVPQVIARNPKRTVWDGKGAYFYWALSKFPYWVIDMFLSSKHSLYKLAALLKQKKKNA